MKTKIFKSFTLVMAILIVAGGLFVFNWLHPKKDQFEMESPTSTKELSFNPATIIGPTANWLIIKKLQKK